ncbi:MAG: hypothetical protein JXB07_07320 [Anaerolineae bacterium]|nr:hypothetical protein [Anaerolineae bacterium]
MPAITRLLGIPEGLSCSLSIIGGITIGLGINWVVDRTLRSIWPSGRRLTTDEQAITLHERSGNTIEIKWAEPIDVLAWYFVVPKERGWVPKGWHCMSCRLLQDGRAITLYTFMKPDEAKAMAQRSAFQELISRKHAAEQGNEHQLKQALAQDPLRAADTDRWTMGAEMLPNDFITLMSKLDRQLSNWPAKNTVEASSGSRTSINKH